VPVGLSLVNQSKNSPPDMDKAIRLFILRLALFEACSVLGFFVGFLRLSFSLFIPFLIIFILSMLTQWPSQQKILQLGK